MRMVSEKSAFNEYYEIPTCPCDHILIHFCTIKKFHTYFIFGVVIEKNNNIISSSSNTLSS